jgi:ABC-type amino acid transport substrate-binding protein
MKLFISIISTVFLLLYPPNAGMAKSYIAAGDESYPPYEYTGKSGAPEGFNIDIIRGIAELGGIDLKIELMPWIDVLSGFERGEVHVITGIFQTKERSRYMLFSYPYLTVSYSLFTQNDSRLKDIKDFRHVSIAVHNGNFAEQIAHNTFPECRIVRVDNEKEGLLLVSTGKTDSVLMSEMSAYYYINGIPIKNIRSIPGAVFTVNYCAAFHKNDERSRMLFNDGLSLLRASGRYDEL